MQEQSREAPLIGREGDPFRYRQLLTAVAI
jgi:hypothetical protein